MTEDGKIYVIEEFECDSFDSGNVVGYCTSKEDADRKCKELENESDKEIEQWNEHCCNCMCQCEAFKYTTDEKAVEAINAIRNSGCPYAKDVNFREVFYGTELKSGGFEIVCGHMVHDMTKFVYAYSECQKLD